MSMSSQDRRADLIAARATGLGVGLIIFMLTWTISARVTERMFAGPADAFIAMAVAIVAGIVVTVRAGIRLGATARVVTEG